MCQLFGSGGQSIGASASAPVLPTIGGGLVTKSCWLLQFHGLQPARLLCPWDSPGKNTGVGCCFLLQSIFLTQESNPGVLHYRQILYWLSYEGSPFQWIFQSKTTLFYCSNCSRFGHWELSQIGSCAPLMCLIFLFHFVSFLIFWHCKMLQAPPVFLCSSFQFSSVQSLSHVKPCDSMDCSTPGLPVHHHSQSLLKLMPIELVMLSNHLILCHPLLLLLLIFPSIKVISSELVLCRSDQISHSVMSDSLRPYESQHARPPCPSPTPRVHSDSCPSSRWCHPAISTSVVPFPSCPQSLPASESFPMSQLFPWGCQSTGVFSALASFLPKKSQGWPPSEWTRWISLQSKGLSRVFSNTTVQKHQFFSAQLSL